MIEHLPLIWKNSVRNKRRSVLTILSIAFSLCLLGVLGVLFQAFFFSEATPQQAMRLIVRNRVSLTNPLPVSYKEKIAAVPGVADLTILQWFGGVYKDPANFFARMAVEPGKLFTIYNEYRIAPAEKQAFETDRGGCVVGRKLAKQYGFQIGDRIPIVGDIFPVTLTFTVRGMYDSERDNETLYFHHEYLNEAMRSAGQAQRLDQVGTFVLRMNRADDATSISKAVDDMFRNSPLQTKTETERAFQLSFLAFLGNVKAFMGVICAAIAFTVLLVSGNTMAMSVRERSREIGVLKTIGFTPGAILSLVTGEAVLISLLGGMLGMLFASGLVAVLRNMPSMVADSSEFVMSPAVLAGGLLTAAAIGLISSIGPAWSASRRNIIDALRVTD